jgi:hypothetical protein
MQKTLAIDLNKIDTELYRTTKEKKIIGTIPKGTSVNITIEQSTPYLMTVEANGVSIHTRSSNWNRYFKVNGKVPSDKTIEHWVCDSVCKSLNGKSVEPDGWDTDGTPSWLLALGLM